jgi:hypothetical protein
LKTHTCILTRTVALSAVVLAVAGGISSRAEEPEPEAAAVLEHFLRSDCGVGEDADPYGPVVAHRETIEPELDRLLREGPDDSVLAEIRSVAEERWVRFESFLSTNPDLGLDPQARLDVVTLTRDEFVTRAVDRFTRAQLERAVIGLTVIGSPSALRTLHDVRQTADDELSEFVDATLRRHRPAGRGSNPTRRLRPGGTVDQREPRHPARD